MEINLHPQYVTIMVRDASLLFQLANCPMLSGSTVTTAWRVLVLSNIHSGLSLGIKRPDRKADHAPPSSVMLKMSATTLMRPYVPTRRGASLSTVGQLCHDLVCSLLCLVGKIILTTCQPVLPEMKRATNTGTWRVHQVCCINVSFDVFIAMLHCWWRVSEGLGFKSLVWDRNPNRDFSWFSSALWKIIAY
jgi:hypothetical protein